MQTSSAVLTKCCAIRTQESKIHGLGCFAGSAIPCGQVIVEYVGEVIDHAEAVRRGVKISQDFSEYILEVSNDVYIDGSHGGNESRFINHCCEPNCRLRRVGDRVFFVAGRPISEGEELTIDYAFDTVVREPCSCGARNCRGYM